MIDWYVLGREIQDHNGCDSDSLNHVREAPVSFTMTACTWRHVGMHSIASCRLVREYNHVQLYKWV